MTKSAATTSADFSLWTVVHDKGALSEDLVGSAAEKAVRVVRMLTSRTNVTRVQWLDWHGDSSLYVLDVALACCALEVEAAGAGRSVAEPPAGARTAVVVSGTVTDRLAPAVASIVDAVRSRPGPDPVVVSFGVCACSGGPYWDSYAVTKGVDQLVEVDVYVAGCPPTPAALRDVLDGLA